MFITLQETTFQNPKNDFSCSHKVYQIFYNKKTPVRLKRFIFMVIGALHALTCKYRHKSFSLFTQSNPYYTTKVKTKSSILVKSPYIYIYNNIRRFFYSIFCFCYVAISNPSTLLPYIMRILC